MTAYVPSGGASLAAAASGMYPAQTSQGGASALYPNFYANGTRNIATGVGNLYAHPMFSGPTPITIDRLDTNIVTLYGAGGVVRAGIYTIINQAYPFGWTLNQPWANLLYDANNQPTDGSTGVKIWSINVTIPANTFFAIAGVELVSGTGTRTVAGSIFSGWSNMGMSNAAASYVSNQGFSLVMQSVAGPALPGQFVPSSPNAGNIDDGIGIRRAA